MANFWLFPQGLTNRKMSLPMRHHQLQRSRFEPIHTLHFNISREERGPKHIKVCGFLSYLLEVDEFRFVCIQEKPSTVVADRIAANARLSVFKLLLHILYHSLTVQTQEGPAHQLRVNRVSTDNLTTDAHQWANLHHGQLTGPAGAQNTSTLVNEAFVQKKIHVYIIVSNIQYFSCKWLISHTLKFSLLVSGW